MYGIERWHFTQVPCCPLFSQRWGDVQWEALNMNAALHQCRPAPRNKSSSLAHWRFCHNIYQRNTWNAGFTRLAERVSRGNWSKDSQGEEGRPKYAMVNCFQGKWPLHPAQATRALKQLEFAPVMLFCQNTSSHIFARSSKATSTFLGRSQVVLTCF